MAQSTAPTGDPAAPRLKLSFETQFCPVYQRNNKAKSKGKDGMKNIRCFPDHGSGGHVEKGFCGSTVSFVVDGNTNGRQVRAWAQFELADESNRAFKRGQTVPLKYVMDELERTRFALGKPWFPTIQNKISSDSTRFTINSERWGWNYSWVSNVHTCDLTHCLCVYLFEVTDNDNLICLEVVPSPEFQVFCSRRRRTPSSPHSASTSPVSISEASNEWDTPPANKRLRASCAKDWREASELTAASLLLMVRTGGSPPSGVSN
jgi:hypothetical protein